MSKVKAWVTRHVNEAVTYADAFYNSGIYSAVGVG